MNSDGCSDLKLVERMFNSPGILYVDAYQRRPPEITTSANSGNSSVSMAPIKPAILLGDYPTALDDLRKDFTRPIWSCKMTFAPNFVVEPANPANTPPSELSKLNELLKSFGERLKNEQEDESSLKITMDVLRQQQPETKQKERIIDTMQWLFLKLVGLVRKEHQRMEKTNIKAETTLPPEEKAQLEKFYQDDYDKFDKFFMGVVLQRNHEALSRFISSFDHYLCRTEDSETTSTLFTVQPRVGPLSLVVHPLLLAIFYNLRQQVLTEEERRKNANRAPNQQGNKPDNKDERFPENKLPCSRIVFLNLDGYQSEFNVDIARIFNRHLMYISFPREWGEIPIPQSQDADLEEIRRENARRRVYSERMMRKYFANDQKVSDELLSKLYQSPNLKQLNKNVFVLPVYSSRMNRIIKDGGLGDEKVGCVQQYQSNFIYYIFKELLCNQISDFNPSVVVVSYSGKLNIEDRHFVEIMKELTKLGNYKVMLFPNLTKCHMFEGDLTEIHQYFQDMYMQAEQGICLRFPDESLNLDLLEKLSIFLKVSSGTYNLSPVHEQESYVEKYRNGKILAYVSLLMDQLKKEYDTINKVHFRSGELVAIANIISKSFGEAKYAELHKSTVGAFHIKLLDRTRELLKDESPEAYFSELVFIHKMYPDSELDDIFNSFEFEYKLQVATQKFFKKTYFTLNRPNESHNRQHRTFPTLMSPQFEVVDGEQLHPLDVSPTNKLLYDRENRSGEEEPLVYLTNVLFRFKGRDTEEFCNFVGRLRRSENRVQLRRVTLENSGEQPYVPLTHWNYHQTREYVFWYWPQRFDMQSWVLLSMAGRSYTPILENLVYRASVDQPEIFRPLEIKENTQRATLPRYGCSSYSMTVGTQTHIYIFGGFYNNENNYLRFQNNVDRLTVDNGPTTIAHLTNVSKSKNINAVRPRTYYDIYEMDSKDGMRNIALIGGYGKNFSRPYCAMGSVWYAVTLNPHNPDHLVVKRQFSKKCYPVNVPRPIHLRTGTKINVLIDDETRNTREQTVRSDSYSFHHFAYNIKNDDIEYKPLFQFGLIEHEVYREEVDELKKSPDDTSAEDTKLRFHKNEGRFSNKLTLFIQNTAHIFELKYEVPHEVKEKHQSIQDTVHLPSSSIISLSCFQTVIYALLRHPVFTLDRCVLAEYNMSSINNVTVSDNDLVLKLQEMHRFRTVFTNNALVVLKAKQIAVLHGPKHNTKGKPAPEYLLKKTRTINETVMVECQHRLIPVPMPGQSKPLLSATAFLKVVDAVHCYSFASRGAKELEYMHLQLNLVEKECAWQLVHSTIFSFGLQLPESMDLTDYLQFYQLNHIQLVQVKLAQRSGKVTEIKQEPQEERRLSPSEIAVTVCLRGKKYEVPYFNEKIKEPLEFKLVIPLEAEGESTNELLQLPKEHEKEPIVLDKSCDFWEDSAIPLEEP